MFAVSLDQVHKACVQVVEDTEGMTGFSMYITHPGPDGITVVEFQRVAVLGKGVELGPPNFLWEQGDVALRFIRYNYKVEWVKVVLPVSSGYGFLSGPIYRLMGAVAYVVMPAGRPMPPLGDMLTDARSLYPAHYAVQRRLWPDETK